MTIGEIVFGPKEPSQTATLIPAEYDRPQKVLPGTSSPAAVAEVRPQAGILGFPHRQSVALCEPLSLCLCSVCSQVDVCLDPTLFPRCRVLAVEGDAVRPRIAASIE